MSKYIKIGGVVIILLAGAAALALHFLLGTTKTMIVGDGVFQVFNESVAGRIGANMTIFETERGLVAVDAHLAPLASGARKKIAKKSALPLIAVFNTHWHPDHTGGNGLLTESADIIAHEETRTILSRPQQGFGLTKPGSVHEFDAVEAEALPEIIVGDAQRFAQYGSQFRAVHYSAAHTNGDLVVFAPEYNVVVLGDLVWPQAFPFIDVHNGGTAMGLRDAIIEITAVTDENQIFLIGHGAPISHSELAAYGEMVSQSIDFVAAEKTSGKSLADIQAAGLPASFDSWHSELVPADIWIKMIFDTI